MYSFDSGQPRLGGGMGPRWGRSAGGAMGPRARVGSCPIGFEGGSFVIPDEYKTSPMEIYSSEPEYDPYYMAEHGALGATGTDPIVPFIAGLGAGTVGAIGGGVLGALATSAADKEHTPALVYVSTALSGLIATGAVTAALRRHPSWWFAVVGGAAASLAGVGGLAMFSRKGE